MNVFLTLLTVTPFEEVLDLKPCTMFHGVEDSLQFELAHWPNIAGVFGEKVTTALKGFQQESITQEVVVDCVKCISSRNPNEGDSVVWLEIGPDEHILSTLFDGHERTASLAKISDVFDKRIVTAIENSDLRKWEKRNGIEDRTECVTLEYRIKARVANDLTIVNDLYAIKPIPSFINGYRNMCRKHYPSTTTAFLCSPDFLIPLEEDDLDTLTT